MGFLNTTAFVLSLLTPQDPGVQVPDTGTTFGISKVLPRDSLVALTVNPIAPHKPAIRETGLWQILEEVAFGGEFGPQMQMGLSQLSMMTGMTQKQMEIAVSSGMGLSFMGMDTEGKPHWVVVMNMAETAKVIGRMLEQGLTMAKAEGTVRSELWQDTLVHSIRIEDGVDLAVALHEELLVLASTQEKLEEVLARRSGFGTPSLWDHPEFKEIAGELTAEGNPLCAFFAQPAELANLLVRTLPTEASRPARNAMKALQVHRLTAFGYGTLVRNGEFHEYARVVFPEPREGLLATVLTGTGSLDPSFYRFIPLDVNGYSLMSISISQILTQIRSLAEAIDPQSGEMIGQSLEGLETQTGVNLEEDLLATLGDQVLSMQWPGGEMFGSDMALVINLLDAVRFQNAWETLHTMLPFPIRESGGQGKKAYRYAISDMEQELWPVLAVAGDYLVVASSNRAFGKVLAQMESQKPNNGARSYLAKHGKTTFLAAWVDLASTMQSQLGELGKLGAMGEHEMIEKLVRAIDMYAGTMRSTAVRDARGVVFRSKSPVGNVQGLAMMSIGASVAIPNLLAARATAPTVTEPAWDSKMTGLMHVIAGAQQEFTTAGIADRDEDGVAEYGDLSELMNSGLLTIGDLGEPVGNGFYKRDGHLIALFLPTDAGERESHYVAVAWPDQGAIGPVYGSTPNRPAMANDIIAGATGIGMIDPRDIYMGGSFSAGLVPGWRDVGTTGSTAPRVQPRGITSGNAAEVRRMHEAEETGDIETLVRLLRSDNPDVAGRAAHVLGRLKATEAVPELCEVMTDRSELEVRELAMGALTQMGDPRSQTVSTQALASESVMMRALAAANLGKIRDPGSVQPLLHMITGADRMAKDQRDVTQALLALHDIGQIDCLLPAATATTSGNDETENALAYLFQNLSPKLGPVDEASSLMSVLDHDSTLLRRYAIQRLGELKDKTTETALENRLAVEDEALAPLIHVALRAVRGDAAEETAGNFVDQVRNKAVALWEEAKPTVDRTWDQAKKKWASLSDQERLIAQAGGGGFVLLTFLLLFMRRRRRRRRRGDEAAAMVAPSAEYEGAHGHEFEHTEPEGEELGFEEWSEEETSVR